MERGFAPVHAMKWVTFLAKANRWAAWTAIIVIILFIVTGYGMTKRVMDPELAKYLHEEILPVPLFIALLVHGGLSLRHAMWRWKIFQNRRTDDFFVFILVLVLFALFMWMHWR